MYLETCYNTGMTTNEDYPEDQPITFPLGGVSEPLENYLARQKVEREESEDCRWCHKPGGDYRVDPYEEELYGRKVERRFHDQCLDELALEI